MTQLDFVRPLNTPGPRWRPLDLDGTILDVPGVRGGTATAGLKDSGAEDVALIAFDQPMAAAGMFTTNAMAAAPVGQCRRALAAGGTFSSVVINSGNANALTGRAGEEAVSAMVDTTEALVGGRTLVMSTGIIGVPLVVHDVVTAIARAHASLGRRGGKRVARAILTTDTCSKHASLEKVAERYTVGGIAKGSGMIHPRMATMLAIMACDVPLPLSDLRSILRLAIDESFHQISVDGDTSTNDGVLLFAPPASSSLPRDQRREVERAVIRCAQALAEQVLEDGEGKSRTMQIDVAGARTPDEAKAVATAVATSSLVKTALAGGDPNWGRILA
ncbi:MAG: bifunctional ornithine acetyltransferase/N-acetylglutamate synthase, partial [Myxococcota bacterium]